MTKYLYMDIIKKKLEYPEEFAIYWRKELKKELDELDWIESYIDCFKWTVSTKLRSFYFQLRCKDIMHNAKLYNMKKCQNPGCNWCTISYQDSIHLFWECGQVRPIWDNVNKWNNVQLGCQLEIKKRIVIFIRHRGWQFYCSI